MNKDIQTSPSFSVGIMSRHLSLVLSHKTETVDHDDDEYRESPRQGCSRHYDG